MSLLALHFVRHSRSSETQQSVGVVLMDGNYRINKYRMTLYTPAIVDSKGHTQPIDHALVAREDCASLVVFLTTVLQCFSTLSLSIFITDKDYAEITAIHQVLLDAAIHLCPGASTEGEVDTVHPILLKRKHAYILIGS